MIVAGSAVAVLLSGFFLWQRFVTDNIMDVPGMENPAYTDDGGEIYPLDGDFTYVDNPALLAVIAGAWESQDGRYSMTLDGDYGITLALDGVTVLAGHIDFTYLQPGKVYWVEFSLDSSALNSEDGTALGEIISLDYETDQVSDKILMEIMRPDGSSETVEFIKSDKIQSEE